LRKSTYFPFSWPATMRRSEESELMDAPDLSKEELARTYSQLAVVQRWLGNTGTIVRLLQRDPSLRLHSSQTTRGRVLDIGCGQGALLREIRKSLRVDVIGFDMRPAPQDAQISIITGDATVDELPEADVAVCMMTAHHMSEDQLERLIRNVSRSCRRFILLDLVRHPVPLVLFRVFVAPLLSRINALDGQTSIRRAFTAMELRGVVERALTTNGRPVQKVAHIVGVLWIRQVVDISW